MSRGLASIEKLRPTDPKHHHVVLKIKFVMSSCGLFWGRPGRGAGEGSFPTLGDGVPTLGVPALVESLVSAFREWRRSLPWSKSELE